MIRARLLTLDEEAQRHIQAADSLAAKALSFAAAEAKSYASIGAPEKLAKHVTGSAHSRDCWKHVQFGC